MYTVQYTGLWKKLKKKQKDGSGYVEEWNHSLILWFYEFEEMETKQFYIKVVL